HGRSCVHSLLSGGHGMVMCVCTHTPASQPGVVHRFWSVSPQGVLSGTGVTSHRPVVVLQTSFVHALLSSHTTGTCVHAAEPASPEVQRSVVQGLLSVQKTTCVLLGVMAATPGVSGVLSCATPPV